ncbi:Ras and EF-hand domain-containing protein [Geodia barretti]|nr:Ras and EF-hand domain-containing protein [Geodia barretti]
MEPLRSEEQVVDGGEGRSSASDQSSLSPASGFNSPDGLGAPGDYCQQVFALCDPEGRGYLTRDTLSRFCDRRNSVLDSIMSTLDHDKDGRISYEEFREGFESYSHNFLLAHGAHMSDEDQHEGGGGRDEEEPLPTDAPTNGPITSTPVLLPVGVRQEDVWESEGARGRGEGEEEDKWGAVAEKIDPDDLLGGNEVGKVWGELASRDPSLLEPFERFLSGVMSELKQSQHDKEKLETHMKRAMDQHNREVMEMEDLLEQHLSEVQEDHQIKSATKTQLLSSRFQALLAARDQVIHQLADKETRLKKELQNKSRSEERLIEEREGLLKANYLLKDQMDKSLRSLSLSRRAVKKGLHRSATVEGGPNSLQGSVEVHHSRQLPAVPVSGSPPVQYFPPKKSPRHSSPQTSIPRELSRELAESSDHTPSSRETTPRPHVQGEPAEGTGERKEAEVEFSLDPHIEGFESRPPSRVLKTSADATRDKNLHHELYQHDPSQAPPTDDPGSHDPHVTKATPTNSALSHLTNDILTYSSQVSRGTPAATSSVSQSTWLPNRNEVQRSSSPMAVNRVFKVVFLGNSGVGKTSLIVRVCQGQFAPVSSTLGLDFCTKTLTVGEERVIFQLWDTAGQER